ncbi:glycine betaine ABC transporter substrate-binding protein [Tessaracoccus terricola]
MTKRILKVIAGAVAVGAALTGCSSDPEAEPTNDNTDSTSQETTATEEKGELTVAVFNGWEEGIATSELWKHVLEEQGYTVELSYVDAAPVFAGLASGDYDFTTDVWLPVTHKDYVESFGDDIVDLSPWFDQAKLTVAVNEDAPIDSLAELAENADLFGNTIVGIEAGAGLTQAMENAVIPGYGLEGMTFQTSSTAAMLAELTAATDAGENIAVTLWEPHWAYEAFPIKNLEDPEGALGGAETIHVYSRTGFADDFPEVAGWLENFEMDGELLYNLEDLLFNQNDTDDYAPLIEQWVEENRDYVDGLTS